ncbi:MAG TPA: hypothetical protein VH598_01020 [Verrucomicrobiae bacterium]|nr:hypothetical protein [Verrucomicrobiae bacterium]
MHKTSLYLVALMVLIAGLLAKLRAAVEKRVPIGYQDENGFHVGLEPSGKESKWPPFW